MTQIIAEVPEGVNSLFDLLSRREDAKSLHSAPFPASGCRGVASSGATVIPQSARAVKAATRARASLSASVSSQVAGEGARGAPALPVPARWLSVAGGSGAGLGGSGREHRERRPTSLDPDQKIGIRENVAIAYELSGLRSVAHRVRECGQKHVVSECLMCGMKVRHIWRCGDRLCPYCAKARSARSYAKYKPLCERPNLKMVGLTLKNVWHVDRAYYREVRHCLTKLRHRQPFCDSWWGGLYSIETTWSLSGGYHVHVHMLVEGEYVPQSVISAAWLAITGDSPIVYIQKADHPHQAFKYIVKPDLVLFSRPHRLAEVIMATRRSKLVQPFGSWRHNHDDAVADDDGSGHLAGDDGDDADRLGKLPPLPCPHCGCTSWKRTVMPVGADVLDMPVVRWDRLTREWIFEYVDGELCSPRAPPCDDPFEGVSW